MPACQSHRNSGDEAMSDKKEGKQEKPKPPCTHVHDHVVCAGRGSAFNVYRCRYCGDEEWL
jgi:hypothetical protein